MTISRQRKWGPLWTQLQQDKKVTVQLQPINMTPEQAAKAYNSFKRAISKEKYEDIVYRHLHPGSQITYDFDPDCYTVAMTLYPNGTSDKLEIL